MKKILKRLGIFGLLIAVLIPFLDLPVVKAATDDGCHLGMNVYLFLDVFNKDEASIYTEGGHKNVAIFSDTFPENAEITGVSNVTNFTENNEYENFYKLYSSIKTNSESSGEETLNEYNNFKTNGGDLSYTNINNIDNITYLVHGSWVDTSSSGSMYKIFTDNIFDMKDTFPTAADFKESCIQNTFTSGTSSEIGLATYDKTGSTALLLDGTPGTENTFGNTNFQTSFNKYILSNKTKAVQDNYKKDSSTILIGINRKMTDAVADELEDKRYYWPEEYRVTYKVCNTTSTEKVVLTYDGNTTDNSATNIPATQSYTINQEVTVQTGASRNKYVFKKWCTEKGGTGTCYVKDDKFNITSNTTLYAQWGEEGTTENGKTGIASYIIGFTSVGIVASGIYLISKKKNLFKQI